MRTSPQAVSSGEFAPILVDAAYKVCFGAWGSSGSAGAKAATDGVGDTWTWMAIDADTKLDRVLFRRWSQRQVRYVVRDVLRSRWAGRVQLTSTGHRAYLEAEKGAFGADYAILNKIDGTVPGTAKGPLQPARLRRSLKERIEGLPYPKQVFTSYVERSNLTIRMRMRRFTRLTNAFSNKIENPAYAVAFHLIYDNFVHIAGPMTSHYTGADVRQHIMTVEGVQVAITSLIVSRASSSFC